MKIFNYVCIAIVLSIAIPVSAQIPIRASGNLLVVGNYNVNQGSSDLGAVIQLETDGGDIVVDEEHPVTYFFNKAKNNLGDESEWMLFDYDDSDWEDGLSAVGYGSVQTTAVVDDNDQGPIYSRFKLFNIPKFASIKSMTIRIDYDDGVIVWLNEVEVLRSNMTTVAEVPGSGWGVSENHESTNKAAPDPNRWNSPVSNLLEVGQDNPEGTIIDYTFDITLDPRPVESQGKLAALWGGLKQD